MWMHLGIAECHVSFSGHCDLDLVHLIFFILVGNQDIHKSMDEFEFWADPITDYGVSCP